VFVVPAVTLGQLGRDPTRGCQTPASRLADRTRPTTASVARAPREHLQCSQ